MKHALILVAAVLGFGLLRPEPIRAQMDGPREIYCPTMAPAITVKKTTLKFAPRRQKLEIRSTIELCTDHEYKIKLKQGQRITLNFLAKTSTVLALYGPKGEALFRTGQLSSSIFDWTGTASQNGTYAIRVLTETFPKKPEQYEINLTATPNRLR